MTDMTTEQLRDRIRVLETEVARQRAILDGSVDFTTVVTDRDGRVTRWNNGAERIFGWSAEEVQGQPVDRIFTDEDRAAGRLQDFDPFFTTKPIGVGTGLGLSMIHGFVHQSGGYVRIYSEVGEGTTVCVYLPHHAGEPDQAGTLPEPPEAPRAEEGETVLVVDDEPAVRMLVTDVLEELGYAALEAGDGASGLRLLQSDARIALLVTDVGLPGGMNGRQMADAARVGRPGLEVLFITGYAESAAIGNGRLDPGMHVMTKPFGMQALATRIRELIMARRATAQPLAGS